MIIVVKVNAPMHMAQGIKETLAMQLERYGDTRVVEVRAEDPRAEQTSIKGL